MPKMGLDNANMRQLSSKSCPTWDPKALTFAFFPLEPLFLTFFKKIFFQQDFLQYHTNMAVNGSNMGPTCPTWGQHGAIIGRTWSQHGPISHQYGGNIGPTCPTWRQHGAITGRTWSQHGPKISKDGPKMCRR